ncbi:MAG: VanZ family protein [Anaerolineae bacterium]
MLRRAVLWLPALAWAAAIFALSAQPSIYSPPNPVMDRLVNGAAHFAEFGVLALLLWLPLSRVSNGGGRRAYVLAGLVACLYAASDELHQSFVPGRDADPIDWLVDCFAVVVSLLSVAQVRAWFRRGRRHEDGSWPPGD